jgi:hypothetical protein
MPTSNGYIGSAATVTKPASFAGGNQSAADLRAFCQSMVTGGTAPGIWSLNAIYDQVRASNWINTFPSNVNPTAGGTLTINSVSLGSYDYTIKYGDQTVSSFTNTDWFTTTADTRSAIIYVRGNLTINSGQTFQPSNRKLFTVIYVDGDLTVNGTLTMSARGANHSGTTKGAIKLVPSGTYSGVTDPQIPADGGAGATAVGVVNGNQTGANGTGGTAGGTGGGGAGGARNNSGIGTATAGSGVGGTSFSGGGGGGGVWTNGTGSAGSATANGGAGGNGAVVNIGGNQPTAFGGAGNPQGTSAGIQSGGPSDGAGTGGVLIIYVKGVLSGSGTISANGVQGVYYTGVGTTGTSGGGGSGGGSVTIFYNTDSSSISPAANGGAGGPATGSCGSGTCEGSSGGAGGAGTARKLAM